MPLHAQGVDRSFDLAFKGGDRIRSCIYATNPLVTDPPAFVRKTATTDQKSTIRKEIFSFCR